MATDYFTDPRTVMLCIFDCSRHINSIVQKELWIVISFLSPGSNPRVKKIGKYLNTSEEFMDIVYVLTACSKFSPHPDFYPVGGLPFHVWLLMHGPSPYRESYINWRLV